MASGRVGAGGQLVRVTGWGESPAPSFSSVPVQGAWRPHRACTHARNSGLAAYLGCESAWEPGKRSEWRTSHLTGYGMESSGHSRALEHAGSGPQREQRHRENRH